MTEPLGQRIVDLYTSEMTMKAVAAEIGRSITFVRCVLVRRKVPIRPRGWKRQAGAEPPDVADLG